MLCSFWVGKACFHKNPLPFTNSQRLRWGGKHGRVEVIEGRLASDGTPKVGNYTGKIFTDVKARAILATPLLCNGETVTTLCA